MGATEALIELLQAAYSGELGAALAYDGHARSVKGVERAEIERIRDEELLHRARVGGMLRELGGAPDPRRERLVGLIGRLISIFCRVGGWYFPMWGAGRIERNNVEEYEHAARLAYAAGRHEWVAELLEMAEVEWDHEAYFRAKCDSHWARHLWPVWRALPPRGAIRASFTLRVAA